MAGGMIARAGLGVLAALAVAPVAGAQTFELKYGVAVTSNYISDGTTQSDDKPALQGYVEGAYGNFYGGVWSSTVDFKGGELGKDGVEFDLFAGYRQDFGKVGIDVSYYRYLYNSSGDCCGEFVLVADYPVEAIGAVGAEFDYDPVSNERWGELAAGVNFGSPWEIGGAIGSDFGSEDLGADDKVAWNAGLTRTLGEIASVDLRYHDSNYDPGTAVLTLYLDF